MGTVLAITAPRPQAPPPGRQEPASEPAHTDYPARARTRETEPGGRVAYGCTGRTVDGLPVWAPLDLAAPGR